MGWWDGNPMRQVMTGDIDYAKELAMQYARPMMFNLKSMMMAGLKQNWLNQTLPDGSTVQVQSIFGQDTVIIDATFAPNIITIPQTTSIKAYSRLLYVSADDYGQYSIIVEEQKVYDLYSDGSKVPAGFQKDTIYIDSIAKQLPIAGSISLPIPGIGQIVCGRFDVADQDKFMIVTYDISPVSVSYDGSNIFSNQTAYLAVHGFHIVKKNNTLTIFYDGVVNGQIKQLLSSSQITTFVDEFDYTVVGTSDVNIYQVKDIYVNNGNYSLLINRSQTHSFSLVLWDVFYTQPQVGGQSYGNFLSKQWIEYGSQVTDGFSYSYQTELFSDFNGFFRYVYTKIFGLAYGGNSILAKQILNDTDFLYISGAMTVTIDVTSVGDEINYDIVITPGITTIPGYLNIPTNDFNTLMSNGIQPDSGYFSIIRPTGKSSVAMDIRETVEFSYAFQIFDWNDLGKLSFTDGVETSNGFPFFLGYLVNPADIAYEGVFIRNPPGHIWDGLCWGDLSLTGTGDGEEISMGTDAIKDNSKVRLSMFNNHYCFLTNRFSSQATRNWIMDALYVVDNGIKPIINGFVGGK